jgi:hypothetical protein
LFSAFADVLHLQIACRETLLVKNTNSGVNTSSGVTQLWTKKQEIS